ncbi:Glycerophosphoryl diester phosphodiesterase (EC [Olavius sp. associated proteobacterium Delta 1]|nr:Glycerophosphoryl diester phosphodiesterase (EC [Olavius sp. associated proteobacterium Delta 1]
MNRLQKAGVIFIGLCVAIFIIYEVLSYLAQPVPDHPYFNPAGFMVIAHRGGRSLGPENTLYTYQRAVDLGVDVLEIDVHLTQDNHLAVIHDKTVDRTTNGSGPVESYKLADLQKLDAGYRWSADRGDAFPLRGKGIKIPILAEVFQAFPLMRINIEIKGSKSAAITSLCRTIQDHNMSQKVMIASFNAAALKKFRSMCPAVATSAGASEAIWFYSLQKMHMESAYSPKAQALQVPENYGDLQVTNKRFVEAAHARNMRVQVWTVNDIDSMKHLLKIGVDGIMTDYPQRLIAILKKK